MRATLRGAIAVMTSGKIRQALHDTVVRVVRERDSSEPQRERRRPDGRVRHHERNPLQSRAPTGPDQLEQVAQALGARGHDRVQLPGI
jgi:hypothetical protein